MSERSVVSASKEGVSPVMRCQTSAVLADEKSKATVAEAFDPAGINLMQLGEEEEETMKKPGRLRGFISNITIQGFRSLRNINDFELSSLNVFIGANGAGKSNLIHFFEMLGWMLRGHDLQRFVVNNGGGSDQLYMGAEETQKMSAAIRFKTEKGANDYRFELSHVPAGDRLIFTRESFRCSADHFDTEAGWSELPTLCPEAQLPLMNSGEEGEKAVTAKVIANLLRDCTVYQFQNTAKTAALHKRWDIDDCARLRSDGGNIAAVLYDLRENDLPRYQYICSQIGRVLPVFEDFILEPSGGSLLLRWKAKNHDKSFGSCLTSDGSLRLFCLITLLNLPDDLNSSAGIRRN